MRIEWTSNGFLESTRDIHRGGKLVTYRSVLNFITSGECSGEAACMENSLNLRHSYYRSGGKI